MKLKHLLVLILWFASQALAVRNMTVSPSTLTAAQQKATVVSRDFNAVKFQLTGTWSATVTFEGTVDNSTWVAIPAWSQNAGTSSTTATSNGLYTVSGSGLTAVRARVSAYTSGSVVVNAMATEGGLTENTGSGGGGGAGDASAANQTTEIGHLSTIAGAVKSEDAAASSGDAGFPMYALQQSSPGNAAANGDYALLQMYLGRLWTSATIDAALPAGTNNIGDIDVLTVPADPFGTNADAASATGSISAKLRFIANTGIPTQSSQAGTWNINNISGTLSLPTGAATDASLTAGYMADNAGFTDGTTKVNPSGYIFDEVAGTALTENDGAAARIDSKRAQVLVIEDATTRGQRASVSASGAVKVDGSATAQPITDNSGSITVDAPVGTPVFTRLSDGSAALGTGHGTAASALRVELPTDGTGLVNTNPGTAANWGVGATGSAAPANAQYAGANSSGNLTGIIQADNSVKISMTTATTTELVALSASKKIYITSWDVIAGGTGTFKLVYGTGTNCGTGTTDVTGAYDLIANAGISKGGGLGPVLVVPASQALCATSSAAVNMRGSVAYTQF